MPVAPYWGGSGAALGTVQPLNVTTFASFVKEVLGHPAIVASVTRDQFQAMPKAGRQAHKRVNYFTPAVFRSEHRAYEDAVHCNLLCLDIDDPKQAQPFVANPAILAERLAPYAFAAYTTASSTLAAPRLRVVVSALAIPVEQYGEAVTWLAKQVLGLSSVTHESKTAVQPMYLPTLFRGDDPVEDHPLIAAVPEGAAVTTASVVGVAPSGNSISPPAKPDDAEAASMEFLRPQVDGVTLADVANALEHLDPDCAYQEWIEAAAAMKHQFPASEEAFRAFLDWSRKGRKFTTDEDTRAKWDSFRSNPRGRVPVTVRTLFRRAAEAGWDRAEAVGARVYTQLLDWLQSGNREATELLQQGIPRIAGAPLLTPLQKGSLLSALQARLAARGAKVTRTELKTSLSKLERSMVASSAPASSTPDTQMPRWARGVCYVGTQNEFFQRHTGRKFTPEVLDNYFGVQLMTGADEASGAPVVRPRDFLLNVMKCPRVDDYIYSPAHGCDAFVVNGHRRAVNLYIPTHPEGDVEGAEAAGKVFLGHLQRLIAEEAYRRTLIDFLATCVQLPGKKIRWAILLQGAQGCGKTVVAEAMRAVLGREHVRSVEASVLFTDFTGWKTGSQLCAIEEIRVVGQNRHEVMNKLKDAISNDYVFVNEKQQKAYQTPNVTNYVMFTNHQDSVAVTDGDRRYFVVNSPLQTKEQVDAQVPPAHFEELWSVIRGRASALRSWFEQWPISSGFNPDGRAPETCYLAQLANAAASPLSAAVQEAIADSTNPLVTSEFISTNVLGSMLHLEHNLEFTTQALSGVLREAGYVKAGRTTMDDVRHNIWTKAGAMVPGDLTLEGLRRMALKDDSLT